MERTAKFLQEAENYFIATIDNDKPRVRPFSTVLVYDGKLYINTGKDKNVSKQIHANPNVEICALNGPQWLRVSATLVEDPRLEVKQAMFDAYKTLQELFSVESENTEVFYLKDAVATFYSVTREPEVETF